ncbi:hypothetical protein B0T22DRAFT_491452 [Podospora appendiculata]|uniref:Uncharacterized protein n=1 Tax=Podospora appendiculata TaxID=314037 RepID=A0AAE1CDZ0_9PEZI|nr:hypothetical protein B0T22DRAFT_491452 [Podospora appendiculata]
MIGIPHLTALAALSLLPLMAAAAPAEAAQAAQVTATPNLNAAAAWWPDGTLEPPNPVDIWPASRVNPSGGERVGKFWSSQWPKGLSNALGARPPVYQTRTQTKLVVITPDVWMVQGVPEATPTPAEPGVALFAAAAAAAAAAAPTPAAAVDAADDNWAPIGYQHDNNNGVEPPARTRDPDSYQYQARDVVPVPSPTPAPSKVTKAATTFLTLVRH